MEAALPGGRDPRSHPSLLRGDRCAAYRAALLAEVGLLGLPQEDVSVPDRHPDDLEQDGGEPEEAKGAKQVDPPRGQREPQDRRDRREDAQEERGGRKQPLPREPDDGRNREGPHGPGAPEICEREDPAYTVLHQNATFTAKRKDIRWKASPSFAMEFRTVNFATN